MVRRTLEDGFALTKRADVTLGKISGIRTSLVKDTFFGVGGPNLRQVWVYHIHRSCREGVHMHHVLSGVWQSGDVSADGAQIPALNSRPHRLLKLRDYLGRLAGGSALTVEQTGSCLISASDMVWHYGVGFPSEPLLGYLRSGASVLAWPCVWFLNPYVRNGTLLGSLSGAFCVLCFWTFARDAENEPIWCLFRWRILNSSLYWENTVANISYSNVF